MYQPLHPHIPTPPTKKLKLMASVGLVAVAFLTIVIVILVLNLTTQYRKTNEQAEIAGTLANALTKSNDEKMLAERQLIIQSLLPELSSFPSQCPRGNEKDGLFTPLSKTPIEGYNVFLVDCRTNITTGKSLPRVLIFRVNNNGGKEFVYGSNTLEPLCISNKLPVANKLATQLAMPVCQTN